MKHQARSKAAPHLLMNRAKPKSASLEVKPLGSMVLRERSTLAALRSP